ncbi:hypothetical protein HPB51_022410 [Rhipicephalus microplus]|uniref:Uncharacterized protein n=1 Tax=Rhipicephalus microplus TaxID=6941 RepID=A0A9J6DQD2_RHIMP|nr:hypothetical protein HPB51_022410 [Rhipicephalus microplus]
MSSSIKEADPQTPSSLKTDTAKQKKGTAVAPSEQWPSLPRSQPYSELHQIPPPSTTLQTSDAMNEDQVKSLLQSLMSTMRVLLSNMKTSAAHTALQVPDTLSMVLVTLSRECKHRHLPKITRLTLERDARSQERVDTTVPDSSAQRPEQPATLRDGHSKSSNRPTWVDKLKTPKGTTIPVTNTPPAPDLHDQELRALRAELSHLTTLITQSPAPSSSQLPSHPPTQTPAHHRVIKQVSHTHLAHSKKKRCADSDD